MPIDHFGLHVPSASFEPFVTFLTTALAPLNFTELVRIPLPNGQFVVGLGEHSGTGTGQADAYLWVSCVPEDLEEAQRRVLRLGHTCFVATDAKQVREFHAAALKAGAQDEGAPGLREPPMYLPGYYAAFVRDPVLGVKVEVVCRRGDV